MSRAIRLAWLLAAALPAPAEEGALAEFPGPLDPEAWGIGRTVPDLSFEDLDGRSGRLSDYCDRKALVLFIRDVGCPVSQNCGPRTAAIEASYESRGVGFLFVDTSPHDSPAECAAEATQYGFDGRYAREHDGRFRFHLKVRTTADVFVLDADRRLRYRGPIDDQFGRGATRPAPTREYLKEALDALLERRTVAEAALTAPGCDLEMPLSAPGEPAPPPEITWSGSIARLVQQRCQGCHHEGGPARFALTEPDDLLGRKAMIRRVIRERLMPPWFATDASGPFTNETQLPAPERLELLRWLQAGGPLGDPREAPPPRAIEEGWVIGEPDFVVAIPKPIEIPAEGVVDYVIVDVPTNLETDVWVQAIQIRCDNPKICHHALVQSFDPESRSVGFVDSYLPGKKASIFPEGTAMLLEKRTVLRFNLHYTPNGTACQETTRIGFKLAKERPRLRVSGKIHRQYKIDIPPGAEDYSVTVEREVPYAVAVTKVLPHMHLRGKSAKVELFWPDGSVTTPLELFRWDPNWQYAYVFETPIELPAGTRIKCTCVFDNSEKNPFNPDPSKRVTQGPQIFDEMAGAFVEWVRPVDAVEREPKGRPRDRQREE